MKKRIRQFLEKYHFREEEAGDKKAYAYLKKYPWILDLGCGEGRFIKLNPKKIKGLDWSQRSIKICQKKGYSVKQGDVRTLPFKKASVPAIHCSHLIEHFLPADVHQILKEIDRVLKPGGLLVIRSPLIWSRFYADLTHIKPYHPAALLHYLTPRHYQNTLEPISDQFQVIDLEWTYAPFPLDIRYLNTLFNLLNRWGFPWLKKNGYFLVLKKNG
jgi:SAM-dependent methyltransferase